MKQLFNTIWRLLKILIIICVLVILIFIVVPTVKYYLSSDWLSKEQIIKLKAEAQKDNCNSALTLFIHYRKIFYMEKEAGKWFIYHKKCNDNKNVPSNF